MQAAPDPEIYRVNNMEVDVLRGCLRRDSQEIRLKPKPFRLLVHLIQQRDRLVTKGEIMDLLWKDTAVTDDALTQCIVEVRRALGDNPREPVYLKTIPRMGFRFVGPVEMAGVAAEEAGEASQKAAREPVASLPLSPMHSSQSLRRWLLLTGLLALSMGAAAFWNKLPWGGAPPAVAAKRVVAILKFENRPGQVDLDWLREGLPDMLETTLSRSGALEIIPRDRVYARRNSTAGGPLDTVELARASHAEIVVAGSYSKLGDRMRVDARVLDARSGALIAAESITIDRPDELLTQVDYLAARIAGRLAPRGRDQDRRALASLMTQNLEAYRAYSLGLEKAEAYHLEDAIALFEKAAALDPGFVMAHARIGYAYAVTDSELARGRPYLERAFRLADKLTERDRRYIVAWYAIANSDYARAMRSYTELIAEYPNDGESYLRLANLLRGDSRHEEALELLRRANGIDAEDPKIYNALSGVLSEMGRHEDAIAMAGRYVQLAPADANAFDSLGLAYQGAGQFDAAAENFTKALALNPEFDVAALHRATLEADMGRFKDGIRDALGVAEKGNRGRPRGWSNAAFIAWRHGRIQEAKSIAARGVQAEGPNTGEWNPAFASISRAGPARPREDYQVGRGARYGNRTVLFYFASQDRLQGRTEQMLEHLHQLIRVRSRWGEAERFEDALGDALAGLGRMDDAIAEYERALRVFPGMALARFHLAQSYQRKGRKAEAVAQYQQFLELWKHADADLPQLAEARAAVGKSP